MGISLRKTFERMAATDFLRNSGYLNLPVYVPTPCVAASAGLRIKAAALPLCARMPMTGLLPGRSHLRGMSLALEQNEALNPFDVRLLGLSPKVP